ncbi:hypothetical protein HMPREF0971_01855 [Segatella oris F0302]|uniref:Uncharacterized protein n=1 Tax=Segatella oris F0302 TaxID=649760 RepID=D1QS98_9BACT|nr:hypothetical protein HMPREF0971_01855 [Segatella oris F0302]
MQCLLRQRLFGYSMKGVRDRKLHLDNMKTIQPGIGTYNIM